MPETRIGRVDKYYGKLGVAVIELTAGPLRLGDTIRIRGATTDFDQQIDSMEVEHARVEQADAGQRVGIQVRSKARHNDVVYRVAP
jgi:translation elongation factor EF-1alpha